MSAKLGKFIKLSLALAGAASILSGVSPAWSMDNFEAGKAYFAKKDFRSAKMYFDKAAADMPWDSNVLYYQGLTGQYLKDWEGSKKVYKKIVEQFPGTDAERNARAALNGLEPGWEKKAKAGSSNGSSSGSGSGSSSAGSSSGSAAGELPPATIDAPASSRVPLVRSGDKVYIDVSINGRTSRMEYAGDETSMSMKEAISLGIVDKTKLPAAGTKVPVTIKMSQITQKNFPINIGSDTERTKIGDDFFKKFTCNLDPSGINAVYRQASALKSGGYDLPFKKSGNAMMVDVTVNGRRVSMAFDEKASECVVPSARAREFGLDVQETSEANMYDPVRNPNGPVRGDVGYGDIKKSAFAEARFQVGPVTSPGIRVKVDDQAKVATMGPGALNGWHADVDKAAGVIHLSR